MAHRQSSAAFAASATTFPPAGTGQLIGPWHISRVLLNVPKAGALGSTNALPSGLDARTLSADLRTRILDLKGDYISDGGDKVDYNGMKTSPAFAEYVDASYALAFVDLDDLDEIEKKALFINVYNSLIIHAIAQDMLPNPGTLARMKMYTSASYVVGGHVFSLNDIENGILRGNRRSAVPFSSLPFAANDPRLRYCCTCDPRIHFALNCGANSCPPIQVYTPSNIDLALRMATKAFLKDCEVNESTGEVHISMLFKWYSGDFGSTSKEIIEWIREHATEEVSEKMARVLNSNSLQIRYMTYDWSLNTTN